MQGRNKADNLSGFCALNREEKRPYNTWMLREEVVQNKDDLIHQF